MSDKNIQNFSLDLAALPLSDDSKKRIVRDFRVSVVKELALHDEGLEGMIVFHGPINGGKVIRDMRAVGDMKVSELANMKVR